jgi:hypothetical protein
LSLTPKRVTVLRELLDLDSSPAWAQDDGFWLPFHLVYFRGSGKRGPVNYAPSWVYEAGMSVDAAAAHLRTLAKLGLVDHRRGRGQSGFKINDAGREALREWDRGTRGRVLSR